MANRLVRCWQADEARKSGREAARRGEPESANPYPVGNYLWCLWGIAWENEVKKRRGWFGQFVDSFFKVEGK